MNSQDDATEHGDLLEGEAELAADPLIGTLLDGKFLIKALVGKGGMSSVYEATQSETERRLAIKVLRAQLSSDEMQARRFRNEARVLSRLEHPNIAKVYGFGATVSGSLYLALEYLAGKSLTELIFRSPLSTEEIIYIFKQIAGAVGHAHQRGIVHRDLKPHNVIILDAAELGWDVKVIDFGISKLVAGDDTEFQRLTATGTVLGTPAYMSPEQAKTAFPDSRSDIYSYGCMLYEALSGHTPFQGDSCPVIMSAHLHAAPPPIPVADPARQALVSIALKCLEKDPANRFQSMESISALLDELEQHGTVDLSITPVAPLKADRFGIPLKTVAVTLVALTCAFFLVDVLSTTMIVPAKEKEEEPRTLSQFVQEANNAYRLATHAFKATNRVDPKTRALFLEAAQNYERAAAMRPGLEELARYTFSWADALALAAVTKDDNLKAARLFERVAALDCERLKKPIPNLRGEGQLRIRQRRAHALVRAATIYLFTLQDLENGRKNTEMALQVDLAPGPDRALFWVAEMSARYSEKPDEAARYADKVLHEVQRWLAYEDVPARFVQAYAEDAVVDYVSAGYTVREAKERVFRLAPGIGRMSSIRTVLDKEFPDGSEKSLPSAHERPSSYYPGVTPR